MCSADRVLANYFWLQRKVVKILWSPVLKRYFAISKQKYKLHLALNQQTSLALTSVQAQVGSEGSKAGADSALASPGHRALWSWNASTVVTTGFYLKVGEREISDALNKGGTTTW